MPNDGDLPCKRFDHAELTGMVTILAVKKSDVSHVLLDMSVDEALKYVISLGMVHPRRLPLKNSGRNDAV